LLEELQARIGHTFQSLDLLHLALTHRSFAYENKSQSMGNYERLEFLGDSVLDLILSEDLMNRFSEADEGVLSKWRASLVNETSLSEIAFELGLNLYLFLGKSEELHRAKPRPRLLASAYEALVAAVYLDAGLETARTMVLRQFTQQLQNLDRELLYSADTKTTLQEWVQKVHKTVPQYKDVRAEGPDHAKVFYVEVWLNETKLGEGQGPSRKAAEQDAARNALLQMEQKN